jgi:hypothetical protein
VDQNDILFDLDNIKSNNRNIHLDLKEYQNQNLTYYFFNSYFKNNLNKYNIHISNLKNVMSNQNKKLQK